MKNESVAIDWDYWRQLDLWTLREATLLYLRTPPDTPDAILRGNFAVAIEYRNLRKMAESSVGVGALLAADRAGGEWRFVPRVLAQWAVAKTRFHGPSELGEFLQDPAAEQAADDNVDAPEAVDKPPPESIALRNERWQRDMDELADNKKRNGESCTRTSLAFEMSKKSENAGVTPETIARRTLSPLTQS